MGKSLSKRADEESISINPATSIIKDISVKTHNNFRAKHNTPGLEWDEELANGAQAWADNLAKTGTFKHADTKGFGENIYRYFTSGDVDLEEATKNGIENWYSEIKNFDFNNPGHKGGVGHFTQVVWKSSKQLGLGITKKPKNGGHEVTMVARYVPAGNMMNTFKDNVAPLN